MSRFLSNKYLKYRAASQGAPIDTDRACDGCGYNLRGLKVGSQCPECGAPIRIEELSQDTLSEAPLPELRKLRSGFLLAMVSIPMLLLAPLGSALAMRNANVVGFALTGVAIAWVVAAYLMTTEIPTAGGRRRGFTADSKLRNWARCLQFGWPLFVIVLLGVPAGGWIRMGGWITGGVCGAAGMFGIVLLSILMMRLSEWCYNDVAETYFNWTIWGMKICVVGVLMSFMHVFFKVFTYTFIAWWIMTFGAFFIAVFSLGKSVTWSVVHANERIERDRQLRESVRRAADEGSTA